MSDLTIANTILEQLGGRQFLSMTGARALVGHPRALSFLLPRIAQNGANRVTVTLDASDTYTVTFARYRKLTDTTVAEVSFVYADQLRDVFTSATGLHTRLF